MRRLKINIQPRKLKNKPKESRKKEFRKIKAEINEKAN